MNKKGTLNVNFSAENYTKTIAPHTRAWATTRKARTLTGVSASVCRVRCSRPTETASCKRRNNLPLTARFQLVENTLNDFRQVVF